MMTHHELLAFLRLDPGYEKTSAVWKMGFHRVAHNLIEMLPPDIRRHLLNREGRLGHFKRLLVRLIELSQDNKALGFKFHNEQLRRRRSHYSTRTIQYIAVTAQRVQAAWAGIIDVQVTVRTEPQSSNDERTTEVCYITVLIPQPLIRHKKDVAP